MPAKFFFCGNTAILHVFNVQKECFVQHKNQKYLSSFFER